MLTRVRDWLKRSGKERTHVANDVVERRPLGEVLRVFAGQWVAVDRITGEPVAAAGSPYKLAAELRSRQIKNVAVVRAPDPSEPELVGLG
jgi:hypothetical protein